MVMTKSISMANKWTLPRFCKSDHPWNSHEGKPRIHDLDPQARGRLGELQVLKYIFNEDYR